MSLKDIILDTYLLLDFPHLATCREMNLRPKPHIDDLS